VKYDKLIRDRIPEIMDSKGKEYKIRQTRNNLELANYLHKKLQEEVDEFLEEPSIEELADIKEVLYALADALGYLPEELEFVRASKRHERGGFSDGIILEEVL
jgi:predicted house-cleaning noncanonical NTP pyrophosphatase (MazG superfamily)